MSTVSRAIYRALEELQQNCEHIKESNEGCDVCPLKNDCLEDTTVLDMAYEVSWSTIDDFIETSNEVTGYSVYESQEAWDDYWANESRQDDVLYED